ncbi:MAG: hypothetical protein QGG02_08445 [Gammaproteobacteria bacterium]|jgi:hypothetical protein|nr:hypothetical protein [Gammaproteobacteria bacterium]MDP6731443.1 hypothetical protein [Gammaproteobacteria bacterium]
MLPVSFKIQGLTLTSRVSWLIFVVMILAIAVVYVVRPRGGIRHDPERLKMVMAE